MAEAFIQLPADSTGKKVRTFDATINSQVVHHQGFVLVNSSGTEISAANPLAVVDPDAAVSGTISATDAVLGTHTGNGALKTGTPTANSYVALPTTGGESSYVVQMTGTFGGGTVWVEVSPDSTNGIDGNWTTALARQSGVTNTFLDESIQAVGIYRGNVSGMRYVRFRVTGATTPSIVIVARASAGPGAVFLNASVPTGSNTIGGVTPGAASGAVVTNVTSAAADTQLLAALTTRKGMLLYNDSAYTLFLKYGTGASNSSFTAPLAPGGWWEMPNPIYTGQVNGIWSSAGGFARITELS